MRSLNATERVNEMREKIINELDLDSLKDRWDCEVRDGKIVLTPRPKTLAEKMQDEPTYVEALPYWNNKADLAIDEFEKIVDEWFSSDGSYDELKQRLKELRGR